MDYHKPQTVDEALSLFSDGSVYVAGGTDLGVLLSEMVISPAEMIDLCGIEEVKGISQSDNGLVIGSCTPIKEIAAADDLPDCLTEGAAAIGSPQIRNVATLGGNICNASPCGDTLTPLMVLDAEFELCGANGRRNLAAADFFRGPKKTALEAGEILTLVKIPASSLEASVTGFRMTGKRNGQVISQVNMAVWARFSNGKMKNIKISAGSVAPVPLRLVNCEKMLQGMAAEDIMKEAFLKDLAAAAEEETSPISDVRAGEDYRRSVSGSLLAEIITDLVSKGVHDEN